MKFTYLPGSQDQGPRYILVPENHIEQKALSVIRDALRADEDARLRLSGSEDSLVNKLDMPANPALQIELTLEAADGTIPSVFIPMESEPDRLDTGRPISRPEHGRPAAIAGGRGAPVKKVGRDGNPSEVRHRNR